MECSVVVPRLRRGVHVDALFVACVSALGIAGWAASGAPRQHTCPTCGTSDSCIVGVRRGVATCTHVWPAIPGLTGLPLRGLSGPALARTGGQPRMIQSGAPGRHLSLDYPVQRAAATAACSLRMIQSGVSGHVSPVNALVVLWPFLLIIPTVIQSRAIHGLVSASLHYHSLDHHHGPLLLAASLLLHGLVLWLLLHITTASSSCLPHCIFTALSSPLLHYVSAASSSSPLPCRTSALSSRLLLCITPASSTGLFH